MLISVIVPTYNACALLTGCLRSLMEQDYPDFEVIVNDDLRTSDGTEQLVQEMGERGMDIHYIKKNFRRAQGRRDAATTAKGEIMLHMDTDMQVSKGLLRECAGLIESGYDALVIPEESFGTTFWARCRWLERQCYDEVEPIEALRCLKSGIYAELGGHNPEMTYYEDKDLDLRVRRLGCKVGRTRNKILHDEGDLHLLDLMRKRAEYARTAVIAADYYPLEIQWLGSVHNRYMLFYQKKDLFFANPLLGLGTIFMKTCEFSVGFFSFLRAKRKLAAGREA